MPLVDRVDDRLDVGVGREQQPGGLGAEPLGLAEDLDARHPGHPLVGHDDVDRRRAARGPRAASAPRAAGEDPVVEPEQVVDRAEDLGLVVDHQERRSRGRSCPRTPPVARTAGRSGRAQPGSWREALDQRHLVARVVVAQLVDHPLADQQPEAPGAEAELVADVEVRERVVGDAACGRFVAVEARPLVADDDLDPVVVDPVGDR